jgi:putative transposase
MGPAALCCHRKSTGLSTSRGRVSKRLEALAARTWRHPFTGLDVRFGTSTIQRWYYAARGSADPVSVLRNHVRRDVGRSPSFSLQAAETLRALYAEHPGWNAQLHHDNLRVKLAEVGIESCPSYPSVLRYLKAHGHWKYCGKI